MSALPLALLGRPMLRRCGFGLLAFVATLLAFTTALLDGEARRLDAQGRAITVAVADADPARQAARAQAVAAMMKTHGDLIAAHTADPAMVAREVGAEDAAALPVMIDATLKPGQSELALRRALAGQAGVAVIRDDGLAPLVGAVARVRHWVRMGFVVLLIVGIAATAMSAGRYLRHDRGLAVARGLGAERRQIAALLRTGFARDAAIGGIAGLAAACIAILFIAAHAQVGDDGGVIAFLTPSDWWTVAALPLPALLLAIASAEAAAWVIEGRR